MIVSLKAVVLICDLQIGFPARGGKTNNVCQTIRQSPLIYIKLVGALQKGVGRIAANIAKLPDLLRRSPPW
jgi:hypothetical protein